MERKDKEVWEMGVFKLIQKRRQDKPSGLVNRCNMQEKNSMSKKSEQWTVRVQTNIEKDKQYRGPTQSVTQIY